MFSSRGRTSATWVVTAAMAAGLGSCERKTEPQPPPLLPPTRVVEPPKPAAAEPPPAPADPPRSPLGTALLAIKDVDGLRALAAPTLVLAEGKIGSKAVKTTKLTSAKLNGKLFEQRIAPRLPREPDPGGGEGEEFACDDEQRLCDFRDPYGNATTYRFTPPPAEAKLREIRFIPRIP